MTGTGHPLAFAVATADARAGGDDDKPFYG